MQNDGALMSENDESQLPKKKSGSIAGRSNTPSEIPYKFLKKKELEETTKLLKISMELTTKLRCKRV